MTHHGTRTEARLGPGSPLRLCATNGDQLRMMCRFLKRSHCGGAAGTHPPRWASVHRPCAAIPGLVWAARKSRFRIVCLCGLFLALSGAALAQSEPRSIEEFVSIQEKWPDLVGTTWRLEGRYSVVADGTMKFVNCPIPFLLPDDIRRPRSRVYEVTGRLERDGREFQFRVSALKPRPDDLEIVLRQRLAIDATDPEAWYKVADWARNRGEFYKDDALLDEAAKLNREGILREYREIDPAEEQALTALIRKARGKRVDSSTLTSMLHDGLRARYADILKNDRNDPAYGTLLAAIAKELPGAIKPLEEYPEELAKRYTEDPRATHTEADRQKRPTLHRLFYVDVMLARITRQARPDGSNGMEIAARIAADVPERSDLVTFYEERELDFRRKQVDVMTRRAMLELARQLEDRDRTEQAEEVKRAWLLAREPLLRDDGARGLVDLAEDWIGLLDDRQSATRFYMAAWKENPDYAPAVTWLKENGYVLDQDRWVRAADVPDHTDVVMDRAVREGRVLPGMTAAQVRAALGTAPDQVTRFATRGRITELWVYESSAITVRLSRRNRPEESIVDSVEPLR